MEKCPVWSPGIGAVQLKLQKSHENAWKWGGGVTDDQISDGLISKERAGSSLITSLYSYLNETHRFG